MNAIRYDEGFDPTLMTDRLVTPWSDVRFRGHLRGRSIPVLAMHSQGFKFLAHPHAFVVHRTHDQSRARLLYEKVCQPLPGHLFSEWIGDICSGRDMLPTKEMLITF